MFETMAFLTTVGLIGIFILLFMMDRAARREDEAAPRDPGAPQQ